MWLSPPAQHGESSHSSSYHSDSWYNCHKVFSADKNMAKFENHHEGPDGLLSVDWCTLNQMPNWQPPQPVGEESMVIIALWWGITPLGLILQEMSFTASRLMIAFCQLGQGHILLGTWGTFEGWWHISELSGALASLREDTDATGSSLVEPHWQAGKYLP